MSALFKWIEAHPGLAAWVQGLGTFLAILVAAIVALAQHVGAQREQRRRAIEHLRSRRQASAHVATTVSNFVGAFSQSIGRAANLESLPHLRSIDRAIQGYHDELSLIPLGDLQDIILCERMLVMRSQILNILELIENLRAYLQRGGSNETEIEARTGNVSKAGEAIAQAASEFAQRIREIS